jgi:hypothetical protein
MNNFSIRITPSLFPAAPSGDPPFFGVASQDGLHPLHSSKYSNNAIQVSCMIRRTPNGW